MWNHFFKIWYIRKCPVKIKPCSMTSILLPGAKC